MCGIITHSVPPDEKRRKKMHLRGRKYFSRLALSLVGRYTGTKRKRGWRIVWNGRGIIYLTQTGGT